MQIYLKISAEYLEYRQNESWLLLKVQKTPFLLHKKLLHKLEWVGGSGSTKILIFQKVERLAS